jgi:hypothetical protein
LLILFAGGRRRNALVLKDVQHVVTYLINYADVHALVLPGRVPGFARDDVKVRIEALFLLACDNPFKSDLAQQYNEIKDLERIL